MLTGHFFRRLKRRRLARGDLNRVSPQMFLAQICDHVVRQFTRISHLTVVAAPVEPTGQEDSEEAGRPPAHPECVNFAGTDYCRESWQLHLAKLSDRPETHWHKCDYGRRCAVVPLVCHNRCLAVFKLVCPESMPESEFESHVELLDVLAEHAAAAERTSLQQLFPPEQPDASTAAGSAAAPEAGQDPPGPPSHPQVLRALEYVEHSLSHPGLTVGHVAGVLGIHPDYLASLFRKEVGQRLSRYICARRVERARNLLATTHWRVERVARESGFANSKWFFHIFQADTGLTPSSYRRKVRSEGKPEVRIS